jgi:membrane associated rhomboid family serine protease
VIPISDENPARLKPVVTWALILACIGVFLWQLSVGEANTDAILDTYGFVPRDFFAQGLSPHPAIAPWLTLITSMFLHGGFLHLGGNMLYLWIFGNNVEDAMGHARYLLFYLTCGVVAALTEGFADPSLAVPMLGASGAISGVLAAYVLIFPKARVIYVVAFWFLLQLFNVVVTSPGAPGTAWGAHVGGFLAGLALTPLLSYFPLFGRRKPSPWE